jgi:hypothetical protein
MSVSRAHWDRIERTYGVQVKNVYDAMMMYEEQACLGLKGNIPNRAKQKGCVSRDGRARRRGRGRWEKIPDTISLLFSVLITDAPDASIFTYPRIVLRLPPSLFVSPSLPSPPPSLSASPSSSPQSSSTSPRISHFWQFTDSQNLRTDSMPLISVIPVVPCRVSSFGRSFVHGQLGFPCTALLSLMCSPLRCLVPSIRTTPPFFVLPSSALCNTTASLFSLQLTKHIPPSADISAIANSEPVEHLSVFSSLGRLVPQ